MYDPYERLANAIVERAIEDYRKLWCWTKYHYAKQEILSFFYSEWFFILTKIDPDWLVEKLEEEANAKRNR